MVARLNRYSERDARNQGPRRAPSRSLVPPAPVAWAPSEQPSGPVEYVRRKDRKEDETEMGSYEPLSVIRQGEQFIVEERGLLKDVDRRHTEYEVYTKKRTIYDLQGNIIEREIYGTEKSRGDDGTYDEYAYLKRRETQSEISRFDRPSVRIAMREAQLAELGVSKEEARSLTPGQQKALLDPRNAQRYTSTPVPAEISSRVEQQRRSKIKSVRDAQGNVFEGEVINGQFIGVREVTRAEQYDRAQLREIRRRPGIARLSNGQVVVSSSAPGSYVNERGELIEVNEPNFSRMDGRATYVPPPSREISGFDLWDEGTRAGLRNAAASGKYQTVGEIYAAARSPTPVLYSQASSEDYLLRGGPLQKITPPPGYRTMAIGRNEQGEIFRVGRRETPFARTVSRAGSWIASASQTYFENPGSFDRRIRDSRVGGVSDWIMGQIVFKLGVAMERRPDDILAQTVAAGIGGRGIGQASGETIVFLEATGRPAAAKATTRILQYGGGGLLAREIIYNENIGENIPALVAGGVGFSRGLRQATATSITELPGRPVSRGQLRMNQDLLGGYGEQVSMVRVQRGRFYQDVPARSGYIISGQRLRLESGSRFYDLELQQQSMVQAFGRNMYADRSFRGLYDTRTNTIALQSPRGDIFLSRSFQGPALVDGDFMPVTGSRSVFQVLETGSSGFPRVVARGRSEGLGLSLDSRRTGISYGFDAWNLERPYGVTGARSAGGRMFSEQEAIIFQRPAGGAQAELFTRGLRMLEARNLLEIPAIQQGRSGLSVWESRRGSFGQDPIFETFNPQRSPARLPRGDAAFIGEPSFAGLPFPEISVPGVRSFAGFGFGAGGAEFFNQRADNMPELVQLPRAWQGFNLRPGQGSGRRPIQDSPQILDFDLAPAFRSSTSADLVFDVFPSGGITPPPGTARPVPPMIELPSLPGFSFELNPRRGRSGSGRGRAGRTRYAPDFTSRLFGITGRQPRGPYGFGEARPLVIGGDL